MKKCILTKADERRTITVDESRVAVTGEGPGYTLDLGSRKKARAFLQVKQDLWSRDGWKEQQNP
jgi:hypothetical protein